MTKERIIVSMAHDVVQALPLADKVYVCRRCGTRGDLEALFHGKRCTPHYESSLSGWLDDTFILPNANGQALKFWMIR